MNEFTCTIDGYDVSFYPSYLFSTERIDWCWIGPQDTPECVADQAFAITQLLNHDPPIPAVQLWLSAGQYGGMTLEEFLEASGV